MDDVWYRDGLRFECTKCGRCCGGPSGFVWVTAVEIEAIAEHRNEPVAQTRVTFVHDVGPRRSLREKTNGDCVFYDSSAGCTIYPVRPRQCRTWPFWDSNTVTPE